MFLSEPSQMKCPPQGTSLGVLIEIVDLGTHENRFKTDGSLRREARLTFRVFPEGTDDDGEFAVSKTITPSIDPRSNFRPWVETLLGRPLTKKETKGFDVQRLLGSACSLEIEHGMSERGRVFGKIVSLSSAPQGTEVPDVREDFVLFSLAPSEFSRATFECLPKWEQEQIERSQEWKKLNGTTDNGHAEKPAAPKRSAHDIIDDDIPFSWIAAFLAPLAMMVMAHVA
jgi:hypothetical protein